MPFLVRRIERVGDLPRPAQRLLEWHGPARQPLGQRLALDQLENERRVAAALLEAVQHADVRVIERRQHARFPLEARQPIGIGGQRPRQHLDRDLAPEARVARPVDLAHAATAEQRRDAVDTDVADR